jgi:hypothetical protein
MASSTEVLLSKTFFRLTPAAMPRLAACNPVLAAVTQHFDETMPSRFSLGLICTHRAYQCRRAGSMIVRSRSEYAGRRSSSTRWSPHTFSTQQIQSATIFQDMVQILDGDNPVKEKTILYHSSQSKFLRKVALILHMLHAAHGELYILREVRTPLVEWRT